MTEIFDQLSNLSIGELNQIIERSQQLIEEKKQEALRLAQLEKERLERERLEKERKRQEEIAELQRRLRELQGEETTTSQSEPVTPQPEPAASEPAAPEPEPVTPQPQTYSMISCPHCRLLIPSDSKFCYHCGKSTERNTTYTNVQPEPPKDYSGPVKYMDESVKKWTMLNGEGEVYPWRDIKMTTPEEATKLACYIQVTTKRILISAESLMKARARTTAFGAIGNLVVEEKGTPWIWMPLNAVKGYRMLNKKEMQIEADKLYTFRTSKASDIYAALQRVIPDKAR